MKWTMIAAAAAVLGLAATARADFGGPDSPPAGYPVTPTMHGAPAGDASGSCATGEKYGTHPLLRKLCWWKSDPGHARASGSMRPPGPAAPPGTLVFPYHVYNRSPRDFFMWEPGR
jgi:hypothetical protein